jgi:hypothetical protein
MVVDILRLFYSSFFTLPKNELCYRSSDSDQRYFRKRKLEDTGSVENELWNDQ